MNNMNHIDELLKNSFEHFEATPPADAWSLIQQGIPKAGPPVNGNPVSQAAVVKSTGIIAKVVIGIVAAAATVVVAKYYFIDSKTQQTNENNTPKTEQPLSVINGQNEPSITNTDATEKNESVSSSANTNSTKPDNRKTQKANINSTDVTSGKIESAVNNAAVPSTDKNEAGNTVTENKPVAPVTKQEQVQKPVVPKPKHHFPEAAVSKLPANAVDNEEQPVVPNTFSPNNDGHNDKYVISIENEKMYDLKIYDKSNNLVFESSSKEVNWDGTKLNSGEPCDEGNYYIVFRYTTGSSDKVKKATTNLRLLR